MDTEMRVLIVDDSEDDAMLMMHELAKSNRPLTHLRVDTPDEMRDALENQEWDVVIADYKMPQFSGPAALRVLQESGLDIPLILVSGTAEDDVGVAMMRAGAQDFIIKNNMSRLSPAVVREMGEAIIRKQRRRAEETARISAANYWTMFQHSPVPIITFDSDAVILQVNSAFENLFGFASNAVTGRHLWDTFELPQNEKMLRADARHIFSGYIIKNSEYECVRKDGSHVDVLVNITPVRDEADNVTMALAMFTDITERKQIEAHKRDFYRRTILAATDGKLFVCEKHEIDSMVGVPLHVWSVTNKEELSQLREDVHRIAEEEGMDKNRVPDLLSCVVESAANAIKHAHGGQASLHKIEDSLVFVISDIGPGIGDLSLPDVALVKGYSTTGTLGMGYKVMINLADRVYLATGPTGTTVAAEVSLHPSNINAWETRSTTNSI